MNSNGSIGPLSWAPRANPVDIVAKAIRALRRATAVWRRRGAEAGADAGGAVDLEALAELDARVLRDIGAPEPLQSRARERRDAQRRRRDDREVGAVAGDWTRW